MRDGVIVMVVRPVGEGEFLYLRRALGRYRDQWWPVAGKVDGDEGPVAAALRELHEETALVPRQLYAIDEPVPNGDPRYRLHGFFAWADAQAPVRLNAEHSDHAWLDVDAVLAMLSPAIHPFIRAVADRFVRAEPPAALLRWSAADGAPFERE